MRKSTSKKSTLSGAISRRAFLQSSTMLTGAFVVGAPAIVRGQNLNDKLNIAIIGVGGRGTGNLGGVQGGNNITVLCDVSQEPLDKFSQHFKEARLEKDFRKVYDHPDDFDAVVVSTAEHTHAFATLPALQLGKHVYCEKPLTHGIWEAREIQKAAAANPKVATQMGIQIHAEKNYRRVVELIQTGAIGSVKEVHVWVSRAWGWHASKEDFDAAKDIVFVQEFPEGETDIPEGFDWNLWLGPAPERPYHEVYFPGPKWYRWWDFGSGTMSDLGSHYIDLPFWALELDHPQTIEASGPPPHPHLAPASMQATYEYAAKGERGPLSLTWYQGVNKPQIWQDGGIPKWDDGILFIGDKGMLLSNYGKHELLPKKDFRGFEPPEPFIPDSIGHYKEWLQACKTGEPTTCNFAYGGKLTEANHLGNVAYRLDKKLEWDPVSLSCPNAPEADALIKRAYRAPWELA
ncbi:MAG: Gfo/Idh/MocA family oxidoreductase [Candidatus Hydrogenedens sp.]|jgi:predicted dehydrogenase|nr:Gfo/Idh/MocA family oxidoreductase [Candidatus Hydrogenedens sp.]